MSELSIIMKLEFLPNEMLIECFSYLNAFDIFYSFDQLNYLFNELIRNIPLYLDFQCAHKSLFDQFCIKMLLNPRMKQQIYSLHLSNKETCGQIKAFLSFFSLDEFSNLRSLTLTEEKQKDMKKLEPVLPFLRKLHSFTSERLFDSRILPVQISSLKKLTISKCQSDQLCQVLQYVHMLTYLNVHNFPIDYGQMNNDTSFNSYIAVNLKRLIIGKFQSKFENFKIFIKQTPKLKSLTISTENTLDMIDAYRWEDLISSSLPYLNVFKFVFTFPRVDENIIVEKFHQFQSDFWLTEHHWYTECLSDINPACIYTIPFMLDTFEFLAFSKGSSNKSISYCNPFDHVTNLIMDHQAITENCPYHFSNVKSLKFQNTCGTSQQTADYLVAKNFIQSVKLIVNLSNLRHLGLSYYSDIETELVLLEILKEAPQLSSITIYQRRLDILYANNDELHSYLNKMIKKVEIKKSKYCLFKNTNELVQFCEIFSNIEQLKCNINQLDDLLFLISHLSKLSMIQVFVAPFYNSEHLFYCFQEVASKLNIIFDINNDSNGVDSVQEKTLCIWMGRHIH